MPTEGASRSTLCVKITTDKGNALPAINLISFLTENAFSQSRTIVEPLKELNAPPAMEDTFFIRDAVWK